MAADLVSVVFVGDTYMGVVNACTLESSEV